MCLRRRARETKEEEDASDTSERATKDVGERETGARIEGQQKHDLRRRRWRHQDDDDDGDDDDDDGDADGSAHQPQQQQEQQPD